MSADWEEIATRGDSAQVIYDRMREHSAEGFVNAFTALQDFLRANGMLHDLERVWRDLLVPELEAQMRAGAERAWRDMNDAPVH
jgi:hypothetical protein